MNATSSALPPEKVRVVRSFGPARNGELLAAGYVVSPRCRFEARNVCSPFYTVLYLLKGRGEYEDSEGGKLDLRPGILVQRFPRRVHTVVRSRQERWVEFFLTIPDSLYHALVHAGTIDARQSILQPGISRLMHLRLRSLLRSLRPDSGVSAAQALAEAHLLLVQLFDMDRDRGRGSDEAMMMRRARELLSRDPAQPLDMPSVATELGVGYEKFRKAFRQLQGLSPKEYRIRRRIDVARHMLGIEQAGIKEVALRLGYPDVPSFVKQFKRVAGVTPSRFRSMP